ncbi:S1 RNA-binding domain-containing protein [bacterium 210820-DFI.6.52]|nr:S1 RNA-binding domain-containing protein [bacterium 210820-DFI.6.52]
MNCYAPEGMPSGRQPAHFDCTANISEAIESGAVLEGIAQKCDNSYNLYIDLGAAMGVLPFRESAVGADLGKVREISVISKVNKPVCFCITGLHEGADGRPVADLSRRLVQEACQRDYLDRLAPGDIIDAAITHFEPFGVFVDIGCGIVSLLPIDCISVSRIAHPRDRFTPGQWLRAVVSGRDGLGRITLTHKELLGTWLENAASFSPGDTVPGVVRSVESYGIFIELLPNLAGLAEVREGIHPGDTVSVYIKSILPEKMKIKLIIIDDFPAGSCHQSRPPLHYYWEGDHIDAFYYSPPSCPREIATVFTPPPGC